jgi:hypothetical protein
MARKQHFFAGRVTERLQEPGAPVVNVKANRSNTLQRMLTRPDSSVRRSRRYVYVDKL